jgi:hypothetical protein
VKPGSIMSMSMPLDTPLLTQVPAMVSLGSQAPACQRLENRVVPLGALILLRAGQGRWWRVKGPPGACRSTHAHALDSSDKGRRRIGRGKDSHRP